MSDQMTIPTCNELGLCQAQFGRTPCESCDLEPKQLAPLRSQFNDAADCKAVASKPVPRPCLELGVCQNRKPLCDECVERPLRLAPGVVDGPYRSKPKVGDVIQQTTNAMRGFRAFLMGAKR